MARHGVNIPQDVLEEIQRLYLAKKKTTHGAIQETIARGVELALIELREQAPGAIDGSSTAAFDKQSKDEINSGDTGLLESELPWVQRFTEILRSGNKLIIEAIQKNVEAFGLILELSGERGSGYAHTAERDLGIGAEEIAGKAHEIAERAKRVAHGDEGSAASRKGRVKKAG